MNATLRHLAVLTALVAGAMTQSAMAVPVESNGCRWRDASGLMTYNIDAGTVYVPRDARPGSLIGTFDRFFFRNNAEGLAVECFNDGTESIGFEATAIAPVFPGSLPPLNGADLNGKVLETGLNNGIGARIKLGFPFQQACTANYFCSSDLVVPFTARADHSYITAIRLAASNSNVTLIKTGPMAAGPNSFSRRLFSASVTGLNTILAYDIVGTVIQSQCSILANPVSADPVKLGTWPASSFTHPGFTTPPTSFSITLSDCESDPSGGNVATAHIRLDGVKGSVPVGDASQGIFTLGDDSTASGMGIQILRDDGLTPVALGVDVPLVAINPTGTTTLPFTARFFQTEDRTNVRSGVAKGSLAFTVTYQ